MYIVRLVHELHVRNAHGVCALESSSLKERPLSTSASIARLVEISHCLASLCTLQVVNYAAAQWFTLLHGA